MSHDRGCPCGKEPYEYEDCTRTDCSRSRARDEIISPPAEAHRRKVRGGGPGNCAQCAIATLLGKPLRSVPDFVALHAGSWLNDLRDWLEHRGYEIVVFEGYKSRRGLWLLDGRSPRCGDDFNLNHIVVMAGDEMFHDPHESEAGVQTARRSYWIMPLDPSKV